MRGYFEIGILNGQYSVNYGTLLRSAYQLGAAGIFFIGKKFKHQISDTTNCTNHVPLREYDTFEEFYNNRPINSLLIGVESPDYGGRPLKDFCHPERAQYLLGCETHGLPKEIIKKCNQIVSIESIRQPSYNVAIAGTLVMYMRMLNGKKI